MNARSTAALAAVVTAALLLWPSPSLAATYYVAPDGNDAAAATADAPWRTLAKAMNAVAPGDTVVLAEGDYEFVAPPKPFEGRMVTIRAADGARGKVTVTGMAAGHQDRGSFLRFDGLTIPCPVRIANARWVQFVRCRITGANRWAIGMVESEHVGVYGCDVTATTGSQVAMEHQKGAEYRFNEIINGTGDALQGNGDDILIEGNWVHDMHPAANTHADGLQLGNTRRLTVRGNLLECPDMRTLFLYSTWRDTVYEDIVIENNVCITGQDRGLLVNPSNDVTIRNNLIVCDPKYAYSRQNVNPGDMKGKVTLRNNILHLLGMDKRGQDVVASNLVMKRNSDRNNWGTELPLVAPEDLFVDRAAKDFRLKEGCPALGAATPGTVPPRDILGRERPKDKPSIGPLERMPNDKPFMEMWQAYFRKMQAEVRPPDPPQQ